MQCTFPAGHVPNFFDVNKNGSRAKPEIRARDNLTLIRWFSRYTTDFKLAITGIEGAHLEVSIDVYMSRVSCKGARATGQELKKWGKQNLKKNETRLRIPSPFTPQTAPSTLTLYDTI